MFDQNIRHSIAASGKYDIAVNLFEKPLLPISLPKSRKTTYFMISSQVPYTIETHLDIRVVDAKDNTVARDLAAIAM